jgi:diguanylate cyclase (GGDEF)-like protein
LPNVATGHFIIDLQTLLAITVFMTVIGGLLLLLTWVQGRNTPNETPALAMWGTGYLLGAAAAGCFGALTPLFGGWALGIGNALLCACYGMFWGGARSFEGRRVRPLLLAAGAALWLIAFQFPLVANSPEARLVVVASITGSYSLMSARELWHARDRELISRWPTLAMAVLHGGFLFARIPFAATLSAAAAYPNARDPVVFVMAFEALFATFCVPFLRVAMSKERAELQQRRAALTDELTGIANRRAFLGDGARLMEQTFADGKALALLVFDLDQFKVINDTVGHHGGDRVLQAFCGLVESLLRHGDLFGRLGGEEFACLLPGASTVEALQFAERVRSEFEETRFPGLAMQSTVSIGVAIATEPDLALTTLLQSADRALYRAKADGRNRVALAPLLLIDWAADDAASPAVVPDDADPIAPPAVVFAGWTAI